MDDLSFSDAESFINYFMRKQGHDVPYSSDAKKLDESLRGIGLTAEANFFHKYALPGTEENLTRISARFMIIMDFQKLTGQSGQKIWLTQHARQELEALQSDASEKLSGLSQYIKNNNPELNNIALRDGRQQLDFIRGAAFGYPVENIAFWLKNYPNNEKLNEAVELNQEMKRKFGIDPGLMRMTRAQASRLLSALEGRELKRVVKKSSGYDSHGTLDPTGFLRFQEGKEL